VLGTLLVGLAAIWMGSANMLHFGRRMVRYGVVGSMLALSALLAASLLSPTVSERWERRLSTVQTHGADPTTLSRIAELNEQIDVWSGTVKTTLVGAGYGSAYGWSKAFYDRLVDTGAFSASGLEQQEHFEFGHNFWVSSLYSGGILFGLALPTVLIYAAWVGLSTSRRLYRERLQIPPAYSITRSTLVIVAVLAITIGGNPFGVRYTGLLAGLSLGMLVASRRALYTRYVGGGFANASGALGTNSVTHVPRRAGS
jgi:hypothetical protein